MLPNCKAFIELIANVHQRGPVIEFGSLNVMLTRALPDLRPLFPGLEYVGLDIRPGVGVDQVADCTDTGLPQFKIGTVIICDTLEHAEDPIAMVREAGRILHTTGVLIITVPFKFPIHHLPDYWRITPQGLDLLFSKATVKDAQGRSHAGEFYRAIYYQGELETPHTVMAFGTRDKETFHRIADHLNQTLQKVPGLRPDDVLSMWVDQETYVQQWLTKKAEQKEKENAPVNA